MDSVIFGHRISIEQKRKVISGIVYECHWIGILSYIDGKNFDAVPIFNTNALQVWHKCFAIGAPGRPKKQDGSLLFSLVRQVDCLPVRC